MNTKNARRTFVLWHVVCLCGILLFPLYRQIMAHIPSMFSSCTMLYVLHLYCAVCGGTRALDALLHLDLLAALRYNAFVTVAILIIIVLDVVAWIRFARKRTPILRLPRWVWVLSVVALVTFFILRNVLVIAFGIDPTGNLAGFWNAVLR